MAEDREDIGELRYRDGGWPLVVGRRRKKKDNILNSVFCIQNSLKNQTRTKK